MKCESLFSVLLSLFTFSSLQAREVIVDDPGTGNTVHLMQQVPNVLGYPEDNDPTLKVTSNVPVSVLRYYDASYLEGQQPVQKQDIYIIAKSNCSSMLDVRVDFTEYDRSNFSFWDTLSYTESISIDIIPSDDTILTDNDFLEPSTFLAYWNYSSFWCNEGVPGFNDTVGVDPEPVKPLEPIIEEITPSPAPVTVNIKENELPDDSASATLPTDSAPKSGMLMTALAGLFGSFMMFRDTSLIRRGSASMLAVFALVGALVVSFHMMQDETASHHAIQSAPQNIHGRRLQEQVVETCSASVEIIIDGCRRSMLYSRVDMEVEAPTVRILEIELTELSNEPNPDNPCTTDFVGSMVFNTTSDSFPAGNITTEVDNKLFLIDSLMDDWVNGVQCARAIEGRPFVDDDGYPLHAQLEAHQAAWSAEKAHFDDINTDVALGNEWAERALGEHASVPAFAAFTIALMSNNAPPTLVQDALSAAMDEVRHAKTSFEVASILLGTTVEPGPIPPSTHTFGADIKGLAMAAAQEGCIDETLSALVAAYEVDTRLDQNLRINESTKSLLKDKIRTIALEEARHSALAWRTVRWACEMDSDACSTVNNVIFDPEHLLRAFDNRFGRYEGSAPAQVVWQEVTSNLIPLAIASADIEKMDCEKAISRHLDGATLLEEMATHIIHHTVCA